jgi:hypothetical protein
MVWQMGITVWRNLLPASWGQKLSSSRKINVDIGGKGPLTDVCRVTWQLLFQAFLSNLCCCVFPHFFLCNFFIYLFIVIVHFIFHTSSISLTYEHHLSSNTCHLMAANVPHCLFFLYLLFSLVYFTYFILYECALKSSRPNNEKTNV